MAKTDEASASDDGRSVAVGILCLTHCRDFALPNENTWASNMLLMAYVALAES
jgi:hypothetical protein